LAKYTHKHITHTSTEHTQTQNTHKHRTHTNTHKHIPAPQLTTTTSTRLNREHKSTRRYRLEDEEKEGEMGDMEFDEIELENIEGTCTSINSYDVDGFTNTNTTKSRSPCCSCVTLLNVLEISTASWLIAAPCTANRFNIKNRVQELSIPRKLCLMVNMFTPA
jgi:hypothetical protein